MDEIGLSGVFDLGNFDSGMNKYMSAIEKANSQTASTASGIGSAFSSIGGTVTSVMGGLVVGAMSKAASAVAGFLPGAINAASDLNETVSKVGVVFGKNSEQVLAWGKNAATAFGLSQSQALAAAGTFGNLFVSMGMAAPQSAKMSEGLVQLAGDLASFNNLDPGEVLEKLRAGVTGSTEPLKSMGINIDAAAIKTKAMKMGLASANGELSASAKAQATYALILEQTKTAQGDFARTSDGFANGQRIIAAQFADITATIGNAFLPIVVKLTGAFAGFLSGIAPRITGFFEGLGQVINAFVAGAPTDFPWEDVLPLWIVPAAYEISKVFEGVVKVIQDFSAGLGGFNYDWHKVFPDWLANIASTISGAIQFVVDNLTTFEGAIAGVGAVLAGAGIYSALTGIATAIAAINLPIVAIIGAAALLGAAWAGDWGGIQEIVTPIIQSIIGWLQQMQYVIEAFASGDVADIDWENVAPAWLVPALQSISTVLDGAFRAVSDFANGLGGFDYDWSKVFPPWLATIMGGISLALKDITIVIQSFTSDVPGAYPWEDIFPGWLATTLHYISGAIQGVQTVIDDIQTGVFGYNYDWENVFPPGIAQTLSTLQGAIKGVVDAFTPLASAIATSGAGAMTEIGNFVTGNQTSFTNLKAIWEGATQTATNIFTGLAGVVSSALPAFISAVAPWANAAVDWLTQAVPLAAGKVSEWATGLVSTVSQHLPAWIASFTAWVAPAVDWLADAISKAPSKIGEWYTALTGAVSEKLTEWSSYLITWAAPMGDWVSTAVSNAPGKIGEWYTALSGAITSKLPDLRTAMLQFATAVVEWIGDQSADILPKLGTWLGKITTWIPGAVSSLRSNMLKMATAMVEWIGDNGADILPKLGTWLGKILAWIPIGVGILTSKMIEFGKALVSWISGSGGATSQADPEMDKFKAALLAALEKIKSGFIQGVQNFVKAWSDTIRNFDWAKLGTDVMNLVKAGLVAAQAAIVASALAIATSVKTKFTEINWSQLGTDILTFIANGLSAAASTLYTKATEIGTTLVTKFKNIDWSSIGKAIIDGIGSGIDALKGQLESKISSMLDSIKQKAKDLLGIGSPSKVFAQYGRWIVEGMINGIASRAGALQTQMTSLIGRLTSTAKGIPALFTEWGQALYGANRPLSDFVSSYGDLVSLGKSWSDLFPNMQGGANFSKAMDSYDRYNSMLQDRMKLLDIIKQNNLNPEAILNLGGGTIDEATPEQIAAAIRKSANYLAGITKDRLAQEQREIQRTWELRGALASYNNQVQRAGTLGQKAMNFFQQTEFDQLSTQFSDLGAQLEKAQQIFVQTGDTSALTRLQDLMNQRAGILSQMQAVQDNVKTDTGKRSAIQAILNQQKQMLDQASTFGYNLAQTFSNYMSSSDQLSSGALRAMAKLQDQLDQSALEQTMKDIASKVFLGGLDTNTQISGVASVWGKMYATSVLDPLLAKLRQVVLLEDQRNSTIAQYNQALQVTKQLQTKQDNLDFLQAQLDLIDKAKGAGVSLGSIFQGISLGPGASITDMLTASNRLMDALTQKAQENIKAQTDPKALALADKQLQLAKLQAQLDLLKQAQAANVNIETVFQGITLGINASTDDILTATTRLTDKLIKQILKDLQISSPSKVMMRIGENIVRGLGVGMERAFANPLLRTSTVATGTVSSSALTVNFGGVNNYSPMDDALFESRIQRVVERAFRG